MRTLSDPTCWILFLLLLIVPGCPWLAGWAIKDHAHCADRVFCFYDDGQCCRVCGGQCP